MESTPKAGTKEGIIYDGLMASGLMTIDFLYWEALCNKYFNINGTIETTKSAYQEHFKLFPIIGLEKPITNGIIIDKVINNELW